jgi:hypothetical protein
MGSSRGAVSDVKPGAAWLPICGDAPTRISAGAAGQDAAAYTFMVTEFALRTREGWRISTIVPVPAHDRIHGNSLH